MPSRIYLQALRTAVGCLGYFGVWGFGRSQLEGLRVEARLMVDYCKFWDVGGFPEIWQHRGIPAGIAIFPIAASMRWKASSSEPYVR